MVYSKPTVKKLNELSEKIEKENLAKLDKGGVERDLANRQIGLEVCPTCGHPDDFAYGECSHCGGASCPECGEPHQLVRPGKTQPTCQCEETE